MSFLKQMPHWLLADIILLVLALFFKFAMRGYGYIAFALIYAAALVTLCRFAPDALWKAAVIVTTVGFMYFCAVEGLIIGSARTDRNAVRKNTSSSSAPPCWMTGRPSRSSTAWRAR